MSTIKYVVLVLLSILFFSVALPASASVCRNYGSHQVCILSIDRSAKNYWEYRAAVSVDGVKRPIEVYNCRSEVKVQQGGAVLPFEENDPGKLICGYFKKLS